MVEEEEEPDIDEETGQYDHENDVNDVILNIVEGSDPDEEDELEHVIPCLETVTRHGRIAGTWQRHFMVDSDSGDDDSNEIYDGSENNSPAGRTESELEIEPEPAPGPELVSRIPGRPVFSVTSYKEVICDICGAEILIS